VFVSDSSAASGPSGHKAPPAQPLYRRLLADTRPLQESPEYRRLWVGGALSSVGSRMTSVAVPVQVYALTHSSLAVGLIGLALAVPLIAIGLLGGAFVDAVDRRILVLVTRSFSALVSVLFAVQAFLGLRQVWLLYALIAVQSAVGAVDMPASRAFIPRLLPPDRIQAASALSFLSFHFGLIVGPLLAGVLIAAAGFGAAYSVDAASFAFSIYAVLRLPPMRVRDVGTQTGLGAVAEGLHFVGRHPILRMALLTDLVATIFGMPFALFPALAATHFGGGVRTVGWLFAAPAIGGFLAAALSGPLAQVRRQGLALMLAVGVWGAATAGFGITRLLWLAVVLLAVAGAADVVNGVFRTTLVQVLTPDALQGRVNGVGFVVGAGGPQLGGVESGVVAQLTTPVFSAVSGGLVCLAGVIVLGVVFPAFGRYVARE
jgi:MFS family permease